MMRTECLSHFCKVIIGTAIVSNTTDSRSCPLQVCDKSWNIIFMKIKVNTSIRAEIVDQIGMSLWHFILCCLYLFGLYILNSLWLYTCHSSRVDNYSSKVQETIAGYLFFVFCAIMYFARDGNIDYSSVLPKSQLFGDFRPGVWKEEGWKLTVTQYSKKY